MYIISYTLIIAFIILMVFYFKSKSSPRIRNIQKRELVDDICSFVYSNGGYLRISSEVSYSGKHASVHIHRPSGSIDRYGFQDHGYDVLDYPGMKALYAQLSRKLSGHVEVSTKEVSGSGSDAITSISSSFTPGGGTGYTANTAGGAGTATIVVGINIWSPEAWEIRSASMAQNNPNKNYKKTF